MHNRGGFEKAACSKLLDQWRNLGEESVLAALWLLLHVVLHSSQR